MKNFIQTAWELQQAEWKLFIDYWWIWLIISVVSIAIVHYLDNKG